MSVSQVAPARRSANLLGWAATLAYSLIAASPSLRTQVTTGEDLAFHVYQYLGTAAALKDGQIVPQVDPGVLDGHGLGTNIFYSPLTAWLVVLFHATVAGWPTAVNLLIVLAFVVCGATMYRFVREASGSVLAGFLAAALYLIAPYHLVDAWVRQDQAELLAMAVLPLVIHGAYRLLRADERAFGKQWTGGVLMVATGMAALILAHLLSAATVGALAAAFALLNIRRLGRVRVLGGLAAGIGLALALSAVFALPLLQVRSLGIYNVFDPQSTFNRLYAERTALRGTPPLRFLVRNPASTRAVHADTTQDIGWVHIAGLACAVAAARWMERRARALVWQFGLLAVVTAYVASDYFPWRAVPALWFIQFPWRLLMLTAFALSVVGGIGFAAAARALFRRRAVLGALIAAVVVGAAGVAGSATLLVGAYHREVFTVGRLHDSLPRSEAAADSAEYLPRALDEHDGSFAALEDAPRSPVVLAGDATISGFVRAGSHSHLTVVTGASAAVVEFPSVYYPGYRATLTVGGRVRPVVTAPSREGLVSLTVPSRTRAKVTVQFGMSRATAVGLGVSVSAVLACIALEISRRLRGSRPSQPVPLFRRRA